MECKKKITSQIRRAQIERAYYESKVKYYIEEIQILNLVLKDLSENENKTSSK